MWISLTIIAVLIIIVFGFVLEPVLRARRDRVELDSASMPEPLPDFMALLNGDDTEEQNLPVSGPDREQGVARSTEPVEGHS